MLGVHIEDVKYFSPQTPELLDLGRIPATRLFALTQLKLLQHTNPDSIESIKTTSMEDVSTRVFEKK